MQHTYMHESSSIKLAIVTLLLLHSSCDNAIYEDMSRPSQLIKNLMSMKIPIYTVNITKQDSVEKIIPTVKYSSYVIQ